MGSSLAEIADTVKMIKEKGLTASGNFPRLFAFQRKELPPMLRTTVFWALFLPLTVLVILAGLPASLLSPDYLHNCGRFWGRAALRLAGTRLQVCGQEYLPLKQAVIYMANHQSQFDILALFAGIPGQFRWLAKAELFRIPLFGLAMRRSGYIPVNRGNRREAMQSMTAAARRIASGTSVVVFPEGTRSENGRLLPLKKGGFLLAIHSQVPIVPIAIHNSGRLLPKGSRILRRGKIQIEILPAIPTTGLRSAASEELTMQVRQALESALARGADRFVF